MKKILTLLCCTCLISTLTACGDDSKNETVSKYCDLVVVAGDTSDDCKILYDKNTKVMYCLYGRLQRHTGITPIYNADGTLKLYEEE